MSLLIRPLSFSFFLPLTADLVDDVANMQDARLLDLVQLSEQRRRLVDVLLGGFAQTIAAKQSSAKKIQIKDPELKVSQFLTCPFQPCKAAGSLSFQV